MENNKNKAIAGIALVVAAVAALLWWSMSGARAVPTPVVDESSADTSSVVVSDARPNDLIVVDSVTLSKGGFVAIHADKNGAPGDIVGVSGYLGAGSHASTPVTLSAVTKDGDTLYAMIHADDGDRVFDPKLDLPLLHGKDTVMMRFKIDKNAPAPADLKY